MDVTTYKEHVAFLSSTEQDRAWPEYIQFLEDPRTRKNEKRKYRFSADRFTLVGGVLYKKSRKKRKRFALDDGTAIEELPPQKVVRADEKESVIEQVHDMLVGRNCGRHPGTNKLQEQIGIKYFWKNFSRDVELWMKKCRGCQKMTKTANKDRDVNPSTDIDTFSQWEMDVLGPFSTPSHCGNNHIIVLTELRTRWVEAFSATDSSAESVFPLLKSVIGRFGVPKVISMGLGQAPVDDLNEKFSSLMGTVRPISFVCCADAMKEPMKTFFNPELCDMISGFVRDGDNLGWESDLQLKLLEYRTTPQHGPGSSSPFELLYGMKPRTSVRGTDGCPDKPESSSGDSLPPLWLNVGQKDSQVSRVSVEVKEEPR